MTMLQVNGVQIPCKGILFDKDGTLLEFLQLWGPWAETLLSQLQARMNELGASFTVEREHVLGTIHNAEGHIVGYDPQGPLAIATVDECTGLLAGQLYATGIPWNEAITTIRQFSSVAMRSVRERKSAEPMPGLLAFLQSCRAKRHTSGSRHFRQYSGKEKHIWVGWGYVPFSPPLWAVIG